MKTQRRIEIYQGSWNFWRSMIKTFKANRKAKIRLKAKLPKSDNPYPAFSQIKILEENRVTFPEL